MYLHLGAETVVRTDSIVAVCDLDNASSSHITREALRAAEKAGKVVNVADDSSSAGRTERPRFIYRSSTPRRF